MGNEQKKSWGAKISQWLPNLYYIGTLVSLCFILAQAYYAKQSVIESSQWEKAKITIDNADKFKRELEKSPLSKDEVYSLGDRSYPDFSTKEGLIAADTLRVTFWRLFENETEAKKEFFRLIDVLNTFAYPIIMGYANEEGSYQMVIRQYYSYGAFIMPDVFHELPNIGHHAKLLFRLWRIKSEIMYVDNLVKQDQETIDNIMKNNNFLYFEGTDTSPAALKRYKKVVESKLKEMKKEIEKFREKSME